MLFLLFLVLGFAIWANIQNEKHNPRIQLSSSFHNVVGDIPIIEHLDDGNLEGSVTSSYIYGNKAVINNEEESPFEELDDAIGRGYYAVTGVTVFRGDRLWDSQ